jgi:hypothetical protein
MSVKSIPTPGGAPGTDGFWPLKKKIVPITDTIAVRTARISAPHQGTSLAGGGGATVGGGDTVGGGVILFLYNTCFIE